ncbi:ATP-binding protein [Sulfuracidifex tepidarius]|uniref:ATP-binding protein n=1 Tax=Sulfuracidifex tepidarius TaxID=1294262 RepID=UPI001E436C12|nr:ATP-binding protein [Sulfuracidifex tepidarius]
MYRKEKKVFFRDPFIYRTLAKWLHRQLRDDAILEHVVQEHLFRKYGEVFYFKNDFEIDIVVGGLKIEVKAERSHRGYPKDVTLLSKGEIPMFLLRGM